MIIATLRPEKFLKQLIKLTIMKTIKFLSTLLVCLVLANIYAFSQTNVDEDEKSETIHINDTYGTGLENQRSTVHLECVLYRSTNSVKVNYSGLGNLNVYILDVQNKVVAYQYGFESNGTIEVPFILENGVYRIYIESDTYCGEGFFEI